MFPFNAAHQPPVPLQITNSSRSIAIPTSPSSSFHAAHPSPNTSFLPNMSRNPPNNHPPILSARPASSSISAPLHSAPAPVSQPPQHTPHHQQTQQTSQDFFGDLEKAFAISSTANQNSTEDGFDVLDDALAMGNQNLSTQVLPSQQPQLHQHHAPHHLSPWPRSLPPSAAATLPVTHASQPPLPTCVDPALQHHHHFSQPNLLPQHQHQHQHPHLLQQHHQLQHHQVHPGYHFQQHHLQQRQLAQPHQQLQQIHQLRQHNFASHTQPHLHSQPPVPQQPHRAQPTQLQSTHIQPSRPEHSQNSQASHQSAQHIQPRNIQQMPSKHIESALLMQGHNPSNLVYPTHAFPPAASGVSAAQVHTQAPAFPSTTPKPLPTPSDSPRTAESSAVTTGKQKKSSSRKQGQRRPRSKSQQAKAAQTRGSQASSPAQSFSQNQQQIPLGGQTSQLQPNMLPQRFQATGQVQVQAQPSQHTFISPQHNVGHSPLHRVRHSPQNMQQIHQQLQNSLLQRQQQQTQAQHQQQQRRVVGNPAAHVQSGMSSMAGSTFNESTSFPSSSFSSLPQTVNSTQEKGQHFGVHIAPRSSGLISQSTSKGVLQLPANEVAGAAKFDAATIEKILASTSDPHLYTALKQQLEILRKNTAGQGLANSYYPVQNHQQNASSAAQVTSGPHLNQQQQRQAYVQQQNAQLQEFQRFRRTESDKFQSSEPPLQAGQGYQQQVPTETMGVLSGHISQSMSSLPQHLQHQIQTQIQARHIQAQLQSQSQLAKQRSVAAGFHNVSSDALNKVGAGPQTSSADYPKQSPSSLRGVGSAQLNGTLAVSQGGANTHPGMSPHSIGFREVVGSAQHNGHRNATDLHVQASQGYVPQHLSVISQRSESPQMAQQQALGSRAMETRATEETKKLEVERKRFAHEAELREITEFKRKRLEDAPINDLSSVLSPDYKSGFNSLADAWQRLLPYHVLLPTDSTKFPEDKWSVEMESLCKKYRGGLRALKGRFDGICELEHENVSAESVGLGIGMLNVDDCIVMEQVLLEDVYESVRKEKELADRKAEKLARQKAIDMEARKLAEQKTAALLPRERTGMQGIGQNVIPESRPQPEYSTNMYGVTLLQGGLQSSSHTFGTLPQISVPNTFERVGASGEQRGTALNRVPGRPSSETDAYLPSGFELSQRTAVSGLPPVHGHTMYNVSMGVHSDVRQVNTGAQQVLQGTSQSAMPYPAALKSVPSLAQASGHVTVHNQRQQDLSRSDKRVRQNHWDSAFSRPPAVLHQKPGLQSQALGVTNHSWPSEASRLNHFRDGSTSKLGSPHAVGSDGKAIPSVGAVANGLTSDECVQTPTGGQMIESVLVPNVGNASSKNDMMKCMATRMHTEPIEQKECRASLSQGLVFRGEGVSSERGESASNTCAPRSGRDAIAENQVVSQEGVHPGSSAGTDLSSPLDTGKGRFDRLEVQNQTSEYLVRSQVSGGVSKRLSARSRPHGPSGEAKSTIRTASPRETDVISEKRPPGNGILPGQDAQDGRPMWTHVGMPSAQTQPSPIASSDTVSVTQKENKEGRISAMGMGSLLNSEGG